MPPTYDMDSSFAADWKRLSNSQKEQFKAAQRQMRIDIANAGDNAITFQPYLRVKGVTAAPGIFEMTWAPDGRATFEYGPEIKPGITHISWRRIGTHDIFKRP